MARYFMHLMDGTDAILDPEGIEMPRGAVPRAALLAARDCIAWDVKNGKIDLHCRIDVHDQSGRLVHGQAFADAIEVVQPKYEAA